MNARRMRRLAVLLPLLVLFLAAGALAQGKVTTPKEFLGFDAGDDYTLANYTQLKGYWEKLAAETARMKLVEIGKTAEGRPMIMAIFTSPENQKNLARYKEISRRLALAEGLDDEQARKLAAEGKAVIWIDGGLHATEVGARPAPVPTRLPDGEPDRRRNDADPERRDSAGRSRQPRRDGTRIGLVHAQPRPEGALDEHPAPVPEVRRARQQPRLLRQHPAGDRRDLAPAVHRVVPARRLQPAPDRPGRHGPVHGAVPRPVQLQLRPAGAAGHRAGRRGHPHPIHRRREAGRSAAGAASYSTWFNGGVRTATYFHNQIGTPERDHRQPDADQHPVRRVAPAADGSQPYPIPAAAGLASAPVDRVPPDGGPGHPGPGVEGPRGLPLPQLRDGPQLDRARQQGHVDDHAQQDRRRPGGDRRRRRSRRAVARIGGQRSRDGWRRTARRRRSGQVLRPAPRPGHSRPARVHPPVRPAGLPHRHAVRQRAAEVRCRDSPRHRAVPGGGQVVPGGLLRREGRAGVPATRDGHVRAAESPRRHPVPGRAAAAGRTMPPAGRSPTRWASSSIGSSTGSTARSNGSRMSSIRLRAKCQPQGTWSATS